MKLFSRLDIFKSLVISNFILKFNKKKILKYYFLNLFSGVYSAIPGLLLVFLNYIWYIFLIICNVQSINNNVILLIGVCHTDMLMYDY